MEGDQAGEVHLLPPGAVKQIVQLLRPAAELRRAALGRSGVVLGVGRVGLTQPIGQVFHHLHRPPGVHPIVGVDVPVVVVLVVVVLVVVVLVVVVMRVVRVILLHVVAVQGGQQVHSLVAVDHRRIGGGQGVIHKVLQPRPV